MKAYENHVRASGQEPSHPLMKELLAGFAAAEVDKCVSRSPSAISPLRSRTSLAQAR
jgi:hypothetical protein